MSGTSSSDDPGEGDGGLIPFGPRYAESEQFNVVFREGMALVEAAAVYLDGDGRREARRLPPAAALAYATESMRLTTRLMQLASWLLIRRAVNEGELTPEEAAEEKHKVKLKPAGPVPRSPIYEDLPARLRALVEASLALNRRIVRLDQLIHAEGPATRPDSHPISQQMERLRSAFASHGGTDGER